MFASHQVSFCVCFGLCLCEHCRFVASHLVKITFLIMYFNLQNFVCQGLIYFCFYFLFFGFFSLLGISFHLLFWGMERYVLLFHYYPCTVWWTVLLNSLFVIYTLNCSFLPFSSNDHQHFFSLFFFQ